MRLLKKRSVPLLLVFFILIGACLRFYNLNWGAPFYFHPDERNIAFAITELRFPGQMNPHFFAYGSLPIYAIYFIGFLNNLFSSCFTGFQNCLSAEALAKADAVSFEQAILVSRIFSATFSILLIPLLFAIGKKLFSISAGLLAATLGTFSVGFIQFAHFGTFEMWLTFFGLLLFWVLIKDEKITKGKILLIGIILGALVAVKVSSLALLPLPMLAIALSHFRDRHRHTTKQLPKVILTTILDTVLILWAGGLVYFFTNPYVLLDTSSFLNSMHYESSLAIGTLPVFYTGEFIHTIPGLYQLFFVYPFLLNPLLTLLSLPAFFWIIKKSWRPFSSEQTLLVLFFLVLFLSQAVLFVKWTRYMVPTLPFLYLVLAGFLTALSQRRTLFKYTETVLVILVALIFALSYTVTAFVEPDTRISAASWASRHFPEQTRILSEVYDLGITPFNPLFPNIQLFNFYDLDNDSQESSLQTLGQAISNTDMVVLPSQRLYKIRLLKPMGFPNGHVFYHNLATQNGYKLLYETPCDLFCRITYLNSPIFSYEETASVFDRPTVMIYQKL